MEVALPDVKRLRSDETKLEVAVAAGAAGEVDDASVGALGIGRSETIFCT